MGKRQWLQFLSSADREEQVLLLAELDGWIDRLNHVNTTVPVLVEGRNDERALRKLGISGEILHLHAGGVSIYERCRWIDRHYAQMILLLDWDRRGRQLRRRVLRFLEADWRTYDMYRREIERLVGAYTQHVEDLARLYEMLFIVVHYEPIRE